LPEVVPRKRGTFGGFVLENIFIRLKMEPFFETAEVFRQQCSQMSGNPVRIRDGCATVTATNSKATGSGKAE